METNPSPVRIKHFQDSLIWWGKSNYVSFPWRKKQSQFHSLVAEILLQRTRAQQVVPVFKKFKKRFSSIKNLAISSREEVKKIITPLGLHWRAKWLHILGVHLFNEKHSRIPDNIDELKKLPGVGPYAASAYLSLHRKIRAPIIDSNVVRFYSRYFGFDSGPETRRARWLHELAERITPALNFTEFNYAVLDFTRVICKPKPICENCIFINECYYNSAIE